MEVHCQATDMQLVPVYVPAFAATHFTCTWMDGQAEFTWVAAYILRWFTHWQMVTLPIQVLTGPGGNLIDHKHILGVEQPQIVANGITNYNKPKHHPN